MRGKDQPDLRGNKMIDLTMASLEHVQNAQ